MGIIRAGDRYPFEPGAEAAGWAIGIVRRSFHGSQSCAPAPRRLPPFLADLEKVVTLFRTAQETMLGLQGAGLIVASPGTTAVTRHEHRLLRAAAAAQAGDDAVVDNYLFKLAPHPQARPPLTHAVTALATSLATSGHWLSAFPLPAPALRVAHLHGIDLGAISVAWAHSAGGNHMNRYAMNSIATQPINALLSRASVSQLQEPGPDGKALDLILQAAMRAPDHGRLRPWRFVLIRGEGRTALADVVERALRRRNPDVTEEMVQRQRARLMNTPLIITLGAHIRPESNIPEIEQILSVGAAAMNMLNAVHALGFGGIWITGPNSYDPIVVSALGIQAPDRVAGFLFVGTPIDEPRGQRRADPGDYTIEWNGDARNML